MSEPEGSRIVDDVGALRTLHGSPSPGAVTKVIDHVDHHARAFLERCPFVLLATRGSGGADCSPRGDAPGFVRVLDDSTLLIPERPGNRRADTLVNIIEDPHIALLALLPGMNETLRVNGRAWIVNDPALLAASAVNGRTPGLGLWIHVEELFMHCAKALVRSQLWDADRHIDRASFPTLGRIILDQVRSEESPAEEAEVRAVDETLAADARENLY